MYARNVVIMRKGYAPAGEVARALGKDRSTVHRMAMTGKLKAIRDGRALYIELASLDSFVVGNRPLVEEVAKLKAEMREIIRAALATDTGFFPDDEEGACGSS